MTKSVIQNPIMNGPRIMRFLILLLAGALASGGVPAAHAAQPSAVPVVFLVFEHPGDAVPIATIVTSETFHPSDVSTGTWVTYAGLFVPGGPNSIISSGRLTARHSPSGLIAEVTQLVGTQGHGKLVVDGPTGELAYTARGGVRGTVHFNFAPVPGPPGAPTFRVDLLDPVPPIFFAGA